MQSYAMKRWALGTALIVGLALVVVGVTTPHLYLYGAPHSIEVHLKRETPLGSSAQQVRVYLQSAGVAPHELRVLPIAPSEDYPLNSTGGASFMHETIGEYRVFLVTSVEVFYTFNANGELVDIRVRKTTDAP